MNVDVSVTRSGRAKRDPGSVNTEKQSSPGWPPQSTISWAMQRRTGLGTVFDEARRAHVVRTPVDVRRWRAGRRRRCDGGEIGVMDEADPVRRQLLGELAQVAAEHWRLGMDERIVAEDEIDAARRHRLQREAVVHVVGDVVRLGEAPLTGLDALRREVDDDQLVAQLLQIVRPAPEPGRDLEDARRGQKAQQARQQDGVPDVLAAAPGDRPLIATLRPRVRVPVLLVHRERRHRSGGVL
jgi:hypothetical protein